MGQQDQIQYAEQDAERMMRAGAIRRTIRPARLWWGLHRLGQVVWLMLLFMVVWPGSKPSMIEIIVFFFWVYPLSYCRDSAVRAMKGYRDVLLQSYSSLALGPTFTDLKILQEGGVSQETIANTGMIYPGQYLGSKSILQGQYRGIPFEQSEMQTIATVHQAAFKTRRAHYVDKAFFCGQWTVVPTNGRYQPVIQIIERGFHNDRSRLFAGYTVGCRYFPKSLGFNYRFRVYAPDREDADRVLTPDTMKQIRRMAAKTCGRLMLCFVNGELHIAVQNNSWPVLASYAAHAWVGTFPPPSVFLPFRQERAIARIQREIAPFTQLLDELLLNKNIFK